MVVRPLVARPLVVRPLVVGLLVVRALVVRRLVRYLGILFICHTITIITKRCPKKNVGRDGEEA